MPRARLLRLGHALLERCRAGLPARRPRELASLLRSAARLGAAPGDAWMLQWCEAAQARLASRQFAPAEAADVLHSLALLATHTPTHSTADGRHAGQPEGSGGVAGRRLPQPGPASATPGAASAQQQQLPAPQPVLLALLAVACGRAPGAPGRAFRASPAQAAAARTARRLGGRGGGIAAAGQQAMLRPMSQYCLAWAVWRLRLAGEHATWAPALLPHAPNTFAVLVPRKQVLLMRSLARACAEAGVQLPPSVAVAWQKAFADAMPRAGPATLAHAASLAADCGLRPPQAWMASLERCLQQRLGVSVSNTLRRSQRPASEFDVTVVTDALARLQYRPSLRTNRSLMLVLCRRRRLQARRAPQPLVLPGRADRPAARGKDVRRARWALQQSVKQQQREQQQAATAGMAAEGLGVSSDNPSNSGPPGTEVPVLGVAADQLGQRRLILRPRPQLLQLAR